MGKTHILQYYRAILENAIIYNRKWYQEDKIKQRTDR